jgi:Cu(I)/Ag(I) efflux system protein CusF
MNLRFAAALITLFGLLPLTAFAASEHMGHGGHNHATMPSTAESQLIDGVVKKIDKTAGKVTVTHGPLTNLNMPAMTMVFRVKEAVWLEQMQSGGKIRFIADSINNTLTIVRFENVK